MENLKDILYDDVEQKFIELQDKKKRRHKRWKRIKLIVIIGGILLGSVYFISDYSKVKSLSVSGNTFYSEYDILDMSDLSYETRYIIMPKALISWNLGKADLVDSVDVSKTLYGAIHLDVKEKKILGYYIAEDGKYNAVVVANPLEKVEVSETDVAKLVHFPYITGFDDEQLQKLVNSFNQSKREVDVEIISMISEIAPYQRSYDEHMVKLVMQDGNIIYSAYDGIPLLNDYKRILRQMVSSHVCLELDDKNATIVSATCK